MERDGVSSKLLSKLSGMLVLEMTHDNGRA